MPDNDTPLEPKPFLAALQEALKPSTVAVAGEKLAEVIEAVREHRKKGTFTLKVELEPDKKLPNVVIVTGTSKVSLPEPEPDPKLLWTTPGGRLATSDPQQSPLPGLRAVEPTDDDTGDTPEEKQA